MEENVIEKNLRARRVNPTSPFNEGGTVTPFTEIGGAAEGLALGFGLA